MAVTAMTHPRIKPQPWRMNASKLRPVWKPIPKPSPSQILCEDSDFSALRVKLFESDPDLSCRLSVIPRYETHTRLFPS
jgi:hypothetical protein